LVQVTFLAPPAPPSAQPPGETLRLYLPQALVQHDDRGAFVWAADQSAGVARRAAIETASTGGNGLVEVTRGLTVSSRIIVGNTEDLRDGMRIRVTGEEANPFRGVDSSAGDANAAGGQAGSLPHGDGRKPLNRLPTGGRP